MCEITMKWQNVLFIAQS